MHCSSCQYVFLLTLAVISPLIARYSPSTSHGSKHSHLASPYQKHQSHPGMRFPGPAMAKGEPSPSSLTSKLPPSYSQRSQGHAWCHSESSPQGEGPPTKQLTTNNRTETPRASSTIITASAALTVTQKAPLSRHRASPCSHRTGHDPTQSPPASSPPSLQNRSNPKRQLIFPNSFLPSVWTAAHPSVQLALHTCRKTRHASWHFPVFSVL